MFMLNTNIEAVVELQDGYPEISHLIKNSNRVILTSGGKHEAAIIPFDEFERYQKYVHVRNVKQKLAEIEELAENPDSWVGIEDLFDAWEG